MSLDRRTCADIAVTAALIAAIISSAVVTRGVVITISSVVGVPAVVSIIIFVRRPGAHDWGSIVPTIYLCVSHTEALLMASNTSYHKCLHGSHQFACHILALFAACICLAILTHDLEREGSILLCFM
jgi:hypothetical protein